MADAPSEAQLKIKIIRNIIAPSPKTNRLLQMPNLRRLKEAAAWFDKVWL